MVGEKVKKISDDAIITVDLHTSNGVIINIKSTVLHMFKKHIENAVKSVVLEFNLKNITINVDDYGALDFVIKARTRSAIKKAIKNEKGEIQK